MKLKSTVILSTIAILLMAFTGPVSTVPLSTLTTPLPVAPAALYTTYLGLVVDNTNNFSSAVSAPQASSTSASIRNVSLSTSTSISSSSYSPQPGDSNLTRDKVFLDLTKSRLIVSSGVPTSVSAVIAGNLPDACHLLRIVVGTSLSTINIQVYSLFKPGTACITVLKPFSATVSLGSFSSGQHTVTVNGLFLGSFGSNPVPVTISSSGGTSATGASGATSSTGISSSSGASTSSSSLSASTSNTSASYAPQPGDALLTRDKVFLDLDKSRLIVFSGIPTRVEAVITGNLPDPCHLLRIVVGPSALGSTIDIQVYSLVKPGTACITVLKPFTVTVPLGSFTSGQFTVMVNGSLLGRFSVTPSLTSPVTN